MADGNSFDHLVSADEERLRGGGGGFVPPGVTVTDPEFAVILICAGYVPY